jgi:hypothetical protein
MRLAKTSLCLLVTAATWAGAPACAADLDAIGVTLLRQMTTNLDGAGVRVAQPEADVDTNLPPTFEVNPAAATVAADRLSYASAYGSSSVFPNAVGGESSHANAVAADFYGRPAGVATNVAHVNNYDADYFMNSVVATSTVIDVRVVNQSFIVYPFDIPTEQMVDSIYDDYAARFNVLFVSGAGNGGGVPVCPPSSCYNGLSVGAYINGTNYSSIGPTLDNGRAKPDITAPDFYTSFSTPQVAGAAALLTQAGLRGDGGSDTNAASDIRTIKALLLNGAVKPPGWTNIAPSPLDARYGAGMLNVFNAYEQLAGGRRPFTVSDSVPAGTGHPPPLDLGAIGALSGWDFNRLTNSASTDAVNHYGFDVTNAAGAAEFTATATLVWNRRLGETNINNLDLFLFDSASGRLMAASTSVVDNVEQLFVPRLPAGHYDLQVLKNGGATVGDTEDYALAFEFFAMTLRLAVSGTNAVITWPVYPDGFILESSTNLLSPAAWAPVASVPVLTNGVHSVVLGRSVSDRYFRLRRP